MTIGDGTLIGHASTLTTLNHGVDPDRRADTIPAPVVIRRKVWLSASVMGSALVRRGEGHSSTTLTSDSSSSTGLRPRWIITSDGCLPRG